jgi:uncharacterized membrane protein YidH (DUF202 family)
MTVDDEGLALERTALAWNRTGLSFAATAAAAARFVEGGLLLASVLLLLAALAWWQGARRCRRQADAVASAPVLRAVAFGTAAVAVAAGVLP